MPLYITFSRIVKEMCQDRRTKGKAKKGERVNLVHAGESEVKHWDNIMIMCEVLKKSDG